MIHLARLGSLELAAHVAARAREKVGAYRAFLAARGVAKDAGFFELPVTDKASYLLGPVYSELLGDDYLETFTIFRSSGSSGHPFYWPQLKSGQPQVVAALRGFLENAFGIQRRRTLAIVGLALGSWIGGDHISWALKSVAVGTEYPFSVFSPGSRHDEIIEMIRSVEGFVDQVILFVCPSAIGHLQLRAEQAGKELPWRKLRFMTLGEPFPESLRERLHVRAELADHEAVMLSVYGSADTGVLGAESVASAVARRLLARRPELAAKLGIPLPAPHLFHLGARDVFLEAPQGELCVTRWQGVPLVRYNLHDAAALLSWEGLRGALLEGDAADEAARKVLEHSAGLSDVIAITGRADRCLILCGTNLTEAMLDETVNSPALREWLTGAYRARIVYEGERQYLAMELEFRPEALADVDAIYGPLVEAMGRAQPEFFDDWQNVYRMWDGDAARRILQVTARRWPELSGSGSIKQRGIEL